MRRAFAALAAPFATLAFASWEPPGVTAPAVLRVLRRLGY
jgi:hypothetical protein